MASFLAVNLGSSFKAGSGNTLSTSMKRHAGGSPFAAGRVSSPSDPCEVCPSNSGGAGGPFFSGLCESHGSVRRGLGTGVCTVIGLPFKFRCRVGFGPCCG